MKRILAWKLNLYVEDVSSTNPRLYSLNTESTIVGEMLLLLHQFLNLLLNEREADFFEVNGKSLIRIFDSVTV